jgi:hypothetical protein
LIFSIGSFCAFGDKTFIGNNMNEYRSFTKEKDKRVSSRNSLCYAFTGIHGDDLQTGQGVKQAVPHVLPVIAM